MHLQSLGTSDLQVTRIAYGCMPLGGGWDQSPIADATRKETVRIIRTFIETGRVLNVVNLSRKTPATHVLVVRHKDEPGVLASIFEALAKEKINTEETENIVFTGAKACIARINLDSAPSEKLLDRMAHDNDAILDLQVVPLGAPAASYQLARSLATT